MATKIGTFCERLGSAQPLLGTFVKTPSSIVAEVLARSGLDVYCIDVEHAPFGRLELDQCIAAFRALDVPTLVRVPSDSPHEIRGALDSGATGILVPHVKTVAQAEGIVKASHFGDGGRGYAGSTRAAEFTTKKMSAHLADSRKHTAIVVQIEDPEALDNVESIAAVDGIDAIFIGRIDLAVAFEKPATDATVISAVKDICTATRRVGTTVGMFTPDISELPEWMAAGASLFLLGSDQSFVLEGASRLRSEFNASLK